MNVGVDVETGSAEREVLEERARRLAEPLGEAGVAQAAARYLVFERAGQRFAVDVLRVTGVATIERLARAPHAPAAVAGLTVIHGVPYVAVDVVGLVGRSGAAGDDEPGAIVMLDAQEVRVGFVADEVMDIVEEGADGDRSPGPAPCAYVERILNGDCAVVDVNAVLNSSALRWT